MKSIMFALGIVPYVLGWLWGLLRESFCDGAREGERYVRYGE